MPIVSLSSLTQGGLISDVNPIEVPLNAFTSVSNVRMKSGGVTSFGGYKDIANLPYDKIAHCMQYIKTTNFNSWIITCANDVYSFTNSFISVKPDSMADVANADDWTITSIGGIAIINHPAIGPFYLSANNSKFVPLKWDSTNTWQEKSQSCDVIAVHKQFMFALSLGDASIERPESVRWSAPADIGGLPPTWDPLDTTQTAGITPLGGTGGKIIGGLSLRDSFIVYRESGITVFDYVGGKYVWRVRHLVSNMGLASKDAVADVNGVHYYISTGDICMNDGNTVKSIATDRVLKVLGLINKSEFKHSFVIDNVAEKEVWFCFPTASSEYSSTVLIYSYLYECWMMRDLPNVIVADVGTYSTEPIVWDDTNTNWDNTSGSWKQRASTPFDKVVLGLVKNSDNTNKIVMLDSPTGFVSTPFSSMIEKTDIAINGVGSVNTVTRLYPRINGIGKLNIQIGSQLHPGAPISWKPPAVFIPGIDKKIDVRSTGPLHAYRITSVEGTSYSITGMDIEYVEDGKR